MEYEVWCSELADHFFDESSAGRPAPFFVDDEALAAIHPTSDHGIAAADLAKAVRAQTNLRSEVSAFERIIRAEAKWREEPAKSPPPSLALLAVFVNAVTQMQAEGGIPSHNYYKRLRALLGMPLEGGMPPGYDLAAKILWPGLRWWLNVYLDGSRGVSVITSHPVFTNIGYAFSQTLLRRSDIHRMSSLFERLDIEPVAGDEQKMDQQISKAELLLQFKAWSHNRAGLSAFAREYAADASYDDILADLLWHAALQWAGGRLDESGRSVGRVRLRLSAAYRPSFSYLVERPDNFPVTLAVDGADLALRSSGTKWYDLTPLSMDDYDHEQSWELQSTDAEGVERVLRYQPNAVVPFREDFDAYCWVSTRTVKPQSPHWVITDKALADEVEAYLDEFAEQGWEPVVHANVPAGYAAYRNVHVTRSAGVSRFQKLWRLKVGAGESLSLRAGMKLPDPPSTWLSGGEPDVWIPSILATASGGEVQLDSEVVQSVPEEGGQVQLSDFAPSPGNHDVQVGPATRRFTTVRTLLLAVQKDAGSLELRLRKSDDHYEWLDSQPTANVGSVPMVNHEVRVAGARIRYMTAGGASGSRPVTLSVGALGYVLLGALPGDIDRPMQPDPPEWLRRAPELEPSRFEVYPYFRVVWVVHVWSRSVTRVRVRERLEPMDTPRTGVPGEEVEEWARWIGELRGPPEGDLDLWNRYVSTAERLLPNA